MNGRILLIVLILLFGWGALEFMQWQLGIGRYAVSPQILQIERESGSLVAGGRAGVTYEDRISGRPRLHVRCDGTDETLRLRVGQPSDQICQVWLTVIDMDDGGSWLRLRVDWDEPPEIEIDTEPATLETAS